METRYAGGKETDKRARSFALNSDPFGSPYRYGHFTCGGIDDRIAATLPPVFNPKMVPRS